MSESWMRRERDELDDLDDLSVDAATDCAEHVAGGRWDRASVAADQYRRHRAELARAFEQRYGRGSQ